MHYHSKRVFQGLLQGQNMQFFRRIHLQATNMKGTKLTTNAEMIVVTDAPINPSHVFLGDNLINGVRPKKKPKI